MKNTYQWKKEPKKLNSMIYIRSGVDREGNPVCYNIYGDGDDEKNEEEEEEFGTQVSREKFMGWRFQLMDKEIQKLDYKPNQISCLVQVNDLNKVASPFRRKDLRLAIKQAAEMLQDGSNPEFVARNVRISLPASLLTIFSFVVMNKYK